MKSRWESLVAGEGLLLFLWVLGVVFFWYRPFPWAAAGWTIVVAVFAAAMALGTWRDTRRARTSPARRASGSRPQAPTSSTTWSGGTGSQALQHASVAIAGVGDIGSRVAVALVQSSVCRLAVADIDVVEIDNIGQSAFRSVDVGESKLASISSICREINPNVDLRYCGTDLREVPEFELALWAGGAALMVLSVDDPRALLRLHDMFYARVPMVAGGVHDGGASGHVVFTLPGRTACLRCALAVSGPNDLVQVKGNTASADDVQRVALETASTVIAMLDPKRKGQLQVDRNLLFITNRSGDGTQNRQSSWLQPERNRKCRICGEGRGL